MKPAHPIAAIAIAAASAAPALACPVADDLQTGIWVRYDDDSLTRYVASGGGTVLEETVFTDGSAEGYDIEVAGGLLKLRSADTLRGAPIPETAETTTYTPDLAAALPLAPGDVVAGQAVTAYADGSPDLVERITVTAFPREEIAIADCTYVAIPMVETLSEGMLSSALRYFFVEDLGIAIYASYAENGEAPETYRALSITDSAP